VADTLYRQLARQRTQIAQLTNEVLDLRKQLDEARAVADPDGETPELSLRDRIMHIGEKAALLSAVVRTCDKARAERDRLRKRLKIRDRG
jgi:hypothetical protein